MNPLSYSKFSLGIHYTDSSSMGVVSSPPPAETSADVASPCIDRTGSVQDVLHMQVLWQRQLQKGHSRQQGGTGMAAIFGPGGLIFLPWTVRGDCPRCDRSTNLTQIKPGLHLPVSVDHLKLSILIPWTLEPPFD